jgi:hypothetical protein
MSTSRHSQALYWQASTGQANCDDGAMLLSSLHATGRGGENSAPTTVLGFFVRLLEVKPERFTFARWDSTPDRIDRCHHAALAPKHAIS